MRRYKPVLSDYEGMQACLDLHSEQGWQLFSVTPDTFRKSEGRGNPADSSPFEELNVHGGQADELTASYYLLMFQREEGRETREAYAEAEESLPMAGSMASSMIGFEDEPRG